MPRKYQLPLKFGFSNSTLPGSNTQVEKTEINKKELLQNTTMLVTLEIGMPGQTRKDYDATEVVHKAYNADSDAGGYSKKLYARKYTYDLTRIAGAARKMLKDKTLPWRGKDRLLPSKLYMDFIAEIGTIKNRFMAAKEDFKNDWTNIIAEAANRHGTMHDPNAYPQVAELDNHFYFNIDIKPVPKGDHFDLREIISDELDILKEELIKTNEKDFNNAASDMWYRLFDVVQSLKIKMTDKDAKAYHKTIITNIEDLLGIMNALNITQDPELERISDEVKTKLCLYDVNDIKKDENLREDIATDAGNIMKDIVQISGITPKPTKVQ